MAGTINYLYDPNQVVWVISTVECDNNILAVESGTVIQLVTTTNATETTLAYDVRVDGKAGTSKYVEADIFPTLNAATLEYEIRLT